MSNLKNEKRVKLLPLLLALQLFLPIQTMANDDNDDKSDATRHGKKAQAMERTAMVLETINGVGEEFVKNYQMRMQQNQSIAATQQMQQTLGLTPVDPSQVPPIISQNGCMVLPARSDQVSSNLTCQGQFDINLFNTGHYDALLTVAEQNVNTLENFLTQGHERFTTQGIGCYEKAGNQLQQQLNARLEMLEQMKESIEARIQAFQKLAENDLKEIKKGAALLDGAMAGGKELQGEMKDYKWENHFSDPQCKSIAQTAFNKVGAEKGLRGIEAVLNGKKDEFKAETFFTKKNQYEQEIRKIAREAGRKARSAESIDAGNILAGIRTREFSTSSQALNQSFQIVQNNAIKKQNQMVSKLDKVLGGEEQLRTLAEAVKNNAVDVKNAVDSWEKDQKNACFNEHMAREFGSVDAFLSRIEDPNISQKANREADSAFKNYVKQILEDNRYSVEEKMQKIADKQKEGNNSRYSLVTGRSFTVKGQQVGASTRLRAQDMVGLFAQDCREGFESDPRQGGFSGRDMAKALLNFASETEAAKKEFANNLETEIISGMIDCPDQQSVGVAAATCSADSTNINHPGFCVRAANVCASNAMACLDKAKKIVEDARKTQKMVAERYNANMDKLKNDLIAEFKAVKGSFEANSRVIDGMFQFGTTFNKNEKPLEAGLTLNFTTSELMDEIQDKSLAIEDPEKYRNKVVKNIDNLKKQVQGHNDQIMAAYNQEIEKYKKNYGVQLAYWKGMASSCIAKVGQEYNSFVDAHNQQQIEQTNQQSEKVVEACNKYQAFRTNPCPSGSGSEFGSLGNDIAAIASNIQDMKAAQQIRETVAYCDAFANEDGGNQYMKPEIKGGGKSSANKFNITLKEFCEQEKAVNTNCQIVLNQEDSYKNMIDQLANNGQCRPANGPEASDESKAPQSNTCKEFISFYEGAKEKAEADLAKWKRAQLHSSIGEIEVAACEGGYNGDPGMPDFSNPDYYRGLASDLMGAGMGVRNH